jgi:hypothetical protein
LLGDDELPPDDPKPKSKLDGSKPAPAGLSILTGVLE